MPQLAQAKAEVTNWVCGAYLSIGEYEKAFDYGKKSVELSKKSGTDISNVWHEFLVQFSLSEMIDIYSACLLYTSDAADYMELVHYGRDLEGAG